MLNLDEGRGKKGAARHAPVEDDWGSDDKPKAKFPKLQISRERKAKDNMRNKMDEAIQLEHSEYGIGKVLDKQSDNVQIMFEHGIENIDLYDDKLVESESLEEARGRPRKDGDDPDGEANQNVVTQLQKVSNGTATHVKFSDGKKHPISSNHARMALDKHSDIEKPNDKASFQDKLGHSHDSFKSTVGIK